MFDFQKLRIWQEGHQLALIVYRLTQAFPREELFGLTSQMRRSASSIPHNIAEGCGRLSRAEMSRFLLIAMGSASEFHSQVMLARDLTYLPGAEAEQLLVSTIRLRRMLTAYYQKIQSTVQDPKTLRSQDPE